MAAKKTVSKAEVLRTIKSRCEICPECGEPWHWPGSPGQKLASQAFIAIGKTRFYVRRTVWDLVIKQPRTKDIDAIITVCADDRCMNPRLLRKVRRGDVIRRSIAEGRIFDAAHRMKVVEARRKHHTTKLDYERAEMIRTDDRATRVIAAEYGITMETVRKVKAGKLWRRQTAANNPFSGLLAA